MQPKNLFFGGGASATLLHPLIAVWMVVAAVLILVLPRNKAIYPFLLAFFTIPFPQVVLIGPLHFPVLRILIMVGLVRRILHLGAPAKDKFPGGFNKIDQATILWCFSSFIVLCLQWMNMAGVIKFSGDLLDAVGGFLVVRYLIPDRDGIKRAIRAFAMVCLIQGVCMMSEQFTHRNVFTVFGANDPTVRDGHVRAEGALGTLFGGTLGAVCVPLFIWLRSQEKSKTIAVVGLLGATAMVVASHASTAVAVYGSGLLGLGFWSLRRQMRLIRWGIAGMLISLHLVMHGPVWSLIEKVDFTGGSSNYHRYMLIDNCIRHFSQWWLIGYRNYGDWGFDMWDLCNQFVATALTGGLISLILFIMIYSRSFSAIGKARKRVEGNRKEEWFLWCMGATVFANVMASFGINYMIQLLMVLFPILACVSVATSTARRTAPASAKPAGKIPLTPAPALTPAYYPNKTTFQVR